LIIRIYRSRWSFSLRSTESGKYPRIECKFELSQTQTDKNKRDNYLFLQEIALSFDCAVKSTKGDSYNPNIELELQT
jgi:hypothetical protein